MRPKKTILCVDDNPTILSVRKFLLETRGYRVLSVTTPQEALDIVARTQPGDIDLLLSDLLMPQMDGNELVRRARQMQPGLPTMIVSGTVTSFDRALAADAFLPKGACTAADMLDRIRVLVARKRGPKKAVRPGLVASMAESSAQPVQHQPVQHQPVQHQPVQHQIAS
jgi:CheY-like chemotaxis protein